MASSTAPATAFRNESKSFKRTDTGLFSEMNENPNRVQIHLDI